MDEPYAANIDDALAACALGAVRARPPAKAEVSDTIWVVSWDRRPPAKPSAGPACAVRRPCGALASRSART